MRVMRVGFPLNKEAAEHEKYVKLTIGGCEIQLAMTGIPIIVNALKSGRNAETLSSYVVSDAITALEEIHEVMWEMCELS